MSKIEEQAGQIVCETMTFSDMENTLIATRKIAKAIRAAREQALEEAEQEAGIMTREEAGDIPDGDGWKAYVKSRKDACARIANLKSKEG